MCGFLDYNRLMSNNWFAFENLESNFLVNKTFFFWGGGGGWGGDSRIFFDSCCDRIYWS